MRISSGRLKGFFGIKKGLGLDEVSIDLSGLSGLIAFDGVNGCGKTTVLENIQPFRTLASRKGALAHHVYTRDAEKEVCFEYVGDDYKTLIKIDAESGRQEGYLWRNDIPQVNGKVSEYDRYITDLLGSETMFFNSIFCAQDSDKISDLTTSQFKALLSEFLGLQRYIEMEDVSKTCAQVLFGRRSKVQTEIEKSVSIIENYSQVRATLGERQQALVDKESARRAIAESIPGIRAELDEARIKASTNAILKDQLQKLEATKPEIEAELAKNIEGSSGELQGLREKVQGIIAEIADAEKILEGKAEILQAAEALPAIIDLLTNTRAALDVAQTSVAETQTQAARNEELRAQSKRLQAERLRLDRELETGGRDEEANLKYHQQKLKEIVEKTVAYEDIIKDKRGTLAACEKVTALTVQLTAKKELYEQVVAEFNSLDLEIMRLQSEIKGLRSAESSLEGRDPACTSIACGLIAHALDAQARIPVIEEEIAIKNSDWEKIRVEKRGLSREIAALETDIIKEGATAAFLPEIEKAESQILECRQREAEIREEAARAKDKWGEQREGLFDKLLSLENEMAQIIAQIDPEADQKAEAALSNIRILKLKITRLEDTETTTRKLAEEINTVTAAESKIEALKQRKEELIKEGVTAKQRWDEARLLIESRLEALEDDILHITNEIDTLVEPKIEILSILLLEKTQDFEKYQSLCDNISSEISGLEVQEKELTRQEGIIENLKAELMDVDREISEWRYLQFACGKDGLRALEIDGAAPAISAFANDLLSESYGADFSVRIRTQGDDGSEVLDVMVTTDNGNEVLLEKLSGGQKVWILKALRMGIICLSKERSGRDYQTLLCDEDDGALSSENAKNFIRLYRSTLQKTGMDTCLFISHRPEALAIADHVIRFNGGIEIER